MRLPKRRRVRALIAFALALPIACMSCVGMTSQDLNAVQTAVALDVAAYNHIDGGAARALMRAAACEDAAVLRRNHVDAGTGSIACP